MKYQLVKLSDRKSDILDKMLSDGKDLKKLTEGEMVDGVVVAIEGTSIYVDLGKYGTGIIYGREFINSKDLIKNIAIGDTVKVMVVDAENEDGYVELSLKEADKALLWSKAEKLMNDNTVIDLKVKEYNKGGLILEWQGISGFLPTSQLKEEHYPRVTNDDKEEILRQLKKLVGEVLSVSIFSISPAENKLIFSEKKNMQEERKKMMTKYMVGDVVECEISGIVDFGVFLKLEDGLEGLVHISEISWSLVEDTRKLYKIGDKVKAKIISIDDSKISLSIKALKPNPWEAAAEKYKVGDVVDGVVIRFNKYGALVSIEEGVAGLIHVSEFESEKQLREELQFGKKYKFKISVFEPNEQRMILVKG